MKRFLQILFTAGALALMILTKGAIHMKFSILGVYTREAYSYFNPITFGSKNYWPFIAAILTCLALILGFAAIKSRACRIILIPLTLAAFAVSLLPLILLGMNRYSLLGAAVSLCLLLSALFAILAMFKKKGPKASPVPGPVPPTGNPPPPPPPPQQ